MENSVIDTAAAIAADPRFTVTRAALLPLLDFMAKRIVEKRNTIPALSNVLIEAEPAGSLRLTATDLDCQLSATIPADDMPVMPVGDATSIFELPAGFVDDLAYIAPFASKDGNRYELNGIALQVSEGGALDCVATDTFTLSRLSYAVPVGAEALANIIIPNKAIAALRALAKLTGDTAPIVEISATKISVAMGGAVLTSKLIDGEFIQWRNLAPIGELAGLMLPELEPRLPSGRVEVLNKAVGKALYWEMGHIGELPCALITAPDVPHWQAVLCGTDEPVYPQGYYADGDCTVEADGVIYPVATKSGRIHLSAETVRALCGPVDPSTHVRIPVKTWWRMKCVAIDGVPTADMPAGYRLNPTSAKGNVRQAVIVPMLEGECIAPVAPPIAEIADSAPLSAEYETTDDSGNIWKHHRDGSQSLVHDETGNAMQKAVEHGQMMRDAAAAFDAEFLAPITPAETQEAPAPASHPASEPETAPQEAEIALAVDVEPDADPMAGIVARLEAIETALDGLQAGSATKSENGGDLSTEPHPFVGMQDNEPLSGELRAKRTAAHVRAIMAYLAMRALRGEMAWRKADWKEGIDRAVTQIDIACAERDLERDKRRRAVVKARDLQNRLHAEHKLVDKYLTKARERNDKLAVAEREIASLKQNMADPSQPERSSDVALLRQSRDGWQAKAQTAIAEGERLRALALQNAGHMESLASRIARAEALLRDQGALPVLSIVPPAEVRAA